VIPHVLEHFHRYDPVELSMNFEFIHVGGEHGQIMKPPFLSTIEDEFPLCARIRDSSDLTIGIALCHPQRQRAPTATEFQNLHAVFDFRVFAGFGECRDLSLIQSFDLVAIMATGVFKAIPQTQQKELCRNFVMLFVGDFGNIGDRTTACHLQKMFKLFLLQFTTIGGDVIESFDQQPSDRAPQNPVGYETTLHPIDAEGNETHIDDSVFGGQGTNGLVVR